MHWLKKLLDDADKKQADLARHLKVRRPAISEVISGKRKLQPREIVPTAEFLGVDQGRVFALVAGRPDPGPVAVDDKTTSQLAAIDVARRLRGIRALCPDLPTQIGVASEVAWAILTNQGYVDPRIAKAISVAARVPIEYVERADSSGLTPDQVAVLLAAALRDRDGLSTYPEEPPPIEERASNRLRRSAARK